MLENNSAAHVNTQLNKADVQYGGECGSVDSVKPLRGYHRVFCLEEPLLCKIQVSV